MEHSSRLDKEILALRARVQALDLERKAFLDLVEQLKEEISEYQRSGRRRLPLPAPAQAEEVAVSSLQGTKDEGRPEGGCVSGKAGMDQEDRQQGGDRLHKRCREVLGTREGRSWEPPHRLQNLEQEQEDSVECNEELESALGGTQIHSRQEKEQLEALHCKILSSGAEAVGEQGSRTELSGEEQAAAGTREIQQVSELLQETEQAQELEQGQEDPRPGEGELTAVGLLEEQIKSLRDEQDLLCSELLESHKKREELEKQLKESSEEKQLWVGEEQALAARAWGPSVREEPLRMSQGMEPGDTRPLLAQSAAGSAGGSVAQRLPDKRCQQQEKMQQLQQEAKMQQLQQELHHAQTLCSSAERELSTEREKNVELQKQNLLLQQECTKWEKSQQKVQELEQELLKSSQAERLQSSLQEKLAQEKSKACEAQKKISKLQQKLKAAQQQLLLAEARGSDKKLLEEELKEARESEARLQQELQEEQLKRKLLEQQVEELRQQLRQSREAEASLAKMHLELQAKTLHLLEDERKSDSSELQRQQEKQKLSEQLTLLKEDNKALYEEGVGLLKQKELCVRKYNEMQLRHKEKLRRAKETFIHEVKQRDRRIKQLENELSLTKLQVEKGQVLMAQLSAKNERLLQERRELLQKRSDHEEPPWSSCCATGTLQSRCEVPRVQVLDEEEVQLQHSKLQLSGHLPSSQRAPRSGHTAGVEDSKSVHVPERQLQSKLLPSPHPSFPAREPPDSPRLSTRDTKPEGEAESQDSAFCFCPSQPSEISYLNVAWPGDTTACQLQEESQSLSSQNF
ncbi:coiled-coil domain-containing protein 30 [Pogoniulus pusillus]|uniref:coiled-coil domain-containing protein 30 n=1 Tax=Pogoniulus pusillus TaxID=488313 RepID=UPI0030B92AE4